MSAPSHTPLEQTLASTGKIHILLKTDLQICQGKPRWLTLRAPCYVGGGKIFFSVLTGRPVRASPTLLRRPRPPIVHVKPAPNLGVEVKYDDVVADRFLVVPDCLLTALANSGCSPSLFAEIESFPVSVD